MSFLSIGAALDHNMPVFMPMSGGRSAMGTGIKKRRSMKGLFGLGATPVRGTRAWWQWYATQYLPQYYSQQQVQSYIYASPYYQQFGSPYQTGLNYNYPYAYTNQQPYPYQQGYQYPYSSYQYGQNYGPQQYGYQYGYGQPQYNQYYGEQGPQLCAQQGGYWDYGQNTCNYTGQSYSGGYGGYGSPPNVVGLPESQAIQMLNQAGYNVWELNVDGVSRGVPPGYSSNRVSLSVQNGTVTGSSVG